MTASETYLLGCFLLDEGQSIDRAVESGLMPADFSEKPNIYGQLRQMRAEGVPIGLDTLLPRMSGEATIVELMEIADPLKLGTSAHFTHHLRQVQEDAARRRFITAAASLKEQAEQGADLEDLNAAAASLAGHPTASRRDRLAALRSRRVSLAHPQPEPVTRLFLADKPISTPGNITTLISRAKTGKTATLGAATAAIITAALGTQVMGYDTFKFRANNPEGRAVIVIDTEQSLYDAYLCYQRSLKRVSATDDPDWLHHYSLVGYGPNQAREALALSCEEAGKVFAVILDGVADLVASVNDEAECNELVTWLRGIATTYDCPIICVIHSNEAEKAGDDGRGHLGKQLIRKAESNLLLKKDGEITTITSDKQRKSPITRADGVSFRWDDEQGMHMLCDPEVREAKGGRVRAHQIEQFMEIIPAPGARPLTGSQIHRMALQIADIKPSTFKDLLAAATQNGTLVRTFDSRTGYSYVRSI